LDENNEVLWRYTEKVDERSAAIDVAYVGEDSGNQYFVIAVIGLATESGTGSELPIPPGNSLHMLPESGYFSRLWLLEVTPQNEARKVALLEVTGEGYAPFISRIAYSNEAEVLAMGGSAFPSSSSFPSAWLASVAVDLPNHNLTGPNNSLYLLADNKTSAATFMDIQFEADRLAAAARVDNFTTGKLAVVMQIYNGFTTLPSLASEITVSDPNSSSGVMALAWPDGTSTPVIAGYTNQGSDQYNAYLAVVSVD
jgi:hypothetical protein